MKILAIEHDPPDVTGEQFTERCCRSPAHVGLHQAGIIRELYFR
jgi:hypothetical protein